MTAERVDSSWPKRETLVGRFRSQRIYQLNTSCFICARTLEVQRMRLAHCLRLNHARIASSRTTASS